MHQNWKYITLALLISNLSNACFAQTTKDPTHLLTCKKLDYILIHHSATDIRPYCNTAEIKCRAMTLVQERPKDDILRKEVEETLKKELRYELDICEIALRKLDPDFLDSR